MYSILCVHVCIIQHDHVFMSARNVTHKPLPDMGPSSHHEPDIHHRFANKDISSICSLAVLARHDKKLFLLVVSVLSDSILISRLLFYKAEPNLYLVRLIQA